MNKFYSKINKALQFYENHRPCRTRNIEWICNCITWCWKQEKITEKEATELNNRVVAILKGDLERMSNEMKDWLSTLASAPECSLEYNHYLCYLFPFLRINEDEDDYKFTWLDEVPKGWRKLFLEMCKEIEPYMTNNKFLQIKEKFGELRVYFMKSTPKLNAIKNKYELLSATTCINCGDKATMITTDWISPYCKKCLPKNTGSRLLADEECQTSPC